MMPMSVAEWEAFERRPGLLPFSQQGAASRAVRRALFAAQDGLCALCGRPMGAANRSVDHVIPKALGGRNCVGNLLIAHSPCNGAKGDRPPTGCEMVWLLAVNNRLNLEPSRW